MADELTNPGGGYKYSAQNLTFSQIVAIVDSDYANRGRATDVANGWRRLAILTERIESYLDSERSLLAENFATQHSPVFFEHVDDVIASADSAVAPAQMNADSLDGAVAEVERLKPIIDDLVAEDALYDQHRNELSLEGSGPVTEYETAKADVLAEAQDEFQVSDQQFAGHRFAMYAPDEFTGPQWHGPDRISDLGGYPDGRPTTGSGVNGPPSSTPSVSGGPQLQSAAPPVATPPPAAAPAPPAAIGGPTGPGAGFAPVPGTPVGRAPVSGKPVGRAPVPGRTAPPPTARPTPGLGNRPSPGTTPRPGGGQSTPSPRGGTGSPKGSAPARGSTPSMRPTSPTGAGRPGSTPAGNARAGSPPASQAKGNASGKTLNAKAPNGKTPAAPRGVVKPNAGFEQAHSRNLPRTTPGVVGSRGGNAASGTSAAKSTPGNRIIGARQAAPKLQPGSLTGRGVVTGERKPTTWSRAQPPRTTTVPRGGVIGRRASFSAAKSDKAAVPTGRQSRRSRRDARIAKLTGKAIAAPQQHELMNGVMDRAVPSVIGKRPNVS